MSLVKPDQILSLCEGFRIVPHRYISIGFHKKKAYEVLRDFGQCEILQNKH